MPISMPTLRSETLEHLGIDATDLDATGSVNLDLIINRSFWQVCDDFDFKEKEQTATFSTVAGTRTYTILTQISPLALESIQNVSVTELNTGQHIPLDMMSVTLFEEVRNDMSSLYAQPTRWMHYGGLLYLDPIPNTIYTITLWFNFILSDLSTANPNVLIPQNWHEAILYGAVERGHIRARDFNSAQQMHEQYQIKIASLSTTESKEDSGNKYAGVRVLRPSYNLRH